MPRESVVEIPAGSGNRYRYNYEDGSTRYLGPVGDGPQISEAEFNMAMKEPRIYFSEIQEFDLENGTSFIRELEMDIEIGSKNNNPLVQQFFKDLRVYGLMEAILYVEGYEDDDLYKPGTTDTLKEVAERYKKAKIHGPEIEEE